MKKSLILALALFCMGVLSANAQSEWNPAPFKHVSLGVGAGTAGADIELATTLGYHFQLRAGISALPLSSSMAYEMDFTSMFEGVEPSVLNAAGVDLDDIPNEVDITAGLGLMNGKVLMDFYPFKNAGLRLTAGVYYGNDKLFSMGMQMPEELMDALDRVHDCDPGFDFGGEFLDAAPDGEIDMFMKVRKVKPYVGFGFGRAVPKRRLGMNMDFGLMFHGTPEIGSSSRDVRRAIDDMLDENGLTDIVEQVIVYPVISFRIVGRIF